MKKITLVLSSLFFAGVVLASNPLSSYSLPYELYLTTQQIVNPMNVKKPIRKAPAAMPSAPVVIVKGHTLLFESALSEGYIELYNEDGELEFVLNVSEGTKRVVFPSFLSGYYTISIVQGNYAFWGEITL